MIVAKEVKYTEIVRMVWVTVELAKQILAERNAHNRPIRRKNVKRISAALTDGTYIFIGDTIVFDEDGNLLNGQHRLLSCVETGVEFRALFVEGVSKAAYKYTDIPEKRNTSDALHISGETDTRALAAVLVLLNAYLTGQFNNKTPMTHDESLALLKDHPGVRDSVEKWRNKAAKLQLITPSVITTAHYLFSKFDVAAADKFVEDVLTGANLGPKDAVLALRTRLMNNSMDKAKLPATDLFALCIKAWNFRREGKEVQVLVYRSGGDNPETFPIAK